MADGTWYYIGACEPEARLNQGWFSLPARRAMLINTSIYADYPGPEDITLVDDGFTEINLLENYAPTRIITVTVKDQQGKPVHGANVHFELYNMAELYPIATLPTNEQGEAILKTGFGDLVIRAVKDGMWGQMKITVADSNRYELVLEATKQPVETVDFDMVPPPELEGEASGALSDERIKYHNQRLEEGTKTRTLYENTFLSEEDASAIARNANLPPERVWDVLQKARGNSREIASFLQKRSSEYGEWPLRLLETLNEKDLVDTFIPTLDDHLTGALAQRGDLPEDTFTSYILSPRILHEMIVPYKHFFQDAYSTEESAVFKSDPSELVRRLEQNFGIWEDLPNLRGRGNPIGTYSMKKGDPVSLDILFVAVCRSLGIPARLHPSEQKPQYWQGGSWEDALFTIASIEEQPEQTAWGMLHLVKDPEATLETPAASYAENFTFARLENGVYKTLVYPDGKRDVYDEPFEVEPGAYRLTSGIRLKDGTVRVRLAFFTICADEQTEVMLTYRETKVDIPVLGNIDRSNNLTLLDGTVKTVGDLIGDRGAIAAWIEPEREPTKHLFRELGELAEPMNKLGVPIILVIGHAEWSSSFDPANYPKLPSTLFL